MPKSLAGSGWASSETPCVMDTPAPDREQPDRSEQRPHVDLAAVTERVRSSAGFAARRCAMSRNTSLPVSAHECAASASIDADPVITAAAVLAIAMSMLATNATMTVSTLSSCWPGARPSRTTPPSTGGPLDARPRCVRP